MKNKQAKHGVYELIYTMGFLSFQPQLERIQIQSAQNYQGARRERGVSPNIFLSWTMETDNRSFLTKQNLVTRGFHSNYSFFYKNFSHQIPPRIDRKSTHYALIHDSTTSLFQGVHF